ncbi:MAG: hypothetical protein WCX14_05910, partial [Dysgonamonadaceae bacterium]
MIVIRLINPINIHNVTPNTNGRIPTDFNTFNDKPEPIKKSVMVIPFLERKTRNEVIFSGKLKIVLATIAN